MKEKVQQAIRKNPWNIYYAQEKNETFDKDMKKCMEWEAKTYRYASILLKPNFKLTPFSKRNRIFFGKKTFA